MLNTQHTFFIRALLQKLGKTHSATNTFFLTFLILFKHCFTFRKRVVRCIGMSAAFLTKIGSGIGSIEVPQQQKEEEEKAWRSWRVIPLLELYVHAPLNPSCTGLSRRWFSENVLRKMYRPLQTVSLYIYWLSLFCPCLISHFAKEALPTRRFSFCQKPFLGGGE